MATTYPSDPVVYNNDYPANTAVGTAALATGDGYLNTAVGANALQSNAYTAVDSDDLVNGQVTSQLDEATGVNNTAVGAYSLASAINGSENTAVGTNAMASIIDGSDNTALGAGALYSAGVDSGTTVAVNKNVAIGADAIANLTSGSRNTSVGYMSGVGATEHSFRDVADCVFLGANTGSAFTASAVSSGLTDICCIGAGAVPHLDESGGLSESHQMVLGGPTMATIYTDAALMIGATNVGDSITNIRYVVQPDGSVTATTVTATGSVSAQSFITTSDQRFKTDVTPVVDAQQTIDQLKPVRFSWIDSEEPDIGFLAQDLLEFQDTIPGIVDSSNPDKLSIAYNRLIPMLVQSVQTLSRRVAILEQEKSQSSA